jgi:hypothetical protein
MAARHANACVWLVGLHRTTGTGPPFAEHIAYRMDAIAVVSRCADAAGA